MTTLIEIEAAVQRLTLPEKQELYRYLSDQLQGTVGASGAPAHGVLDVVPVSLGAILTPLPGEDDLLGEMLDGRQ